MIAHHDPDQRPDREHFAYVRPVIYALATGTVLLSKFGINLSLASFPVNPRSIFSQDSTAARKSRKPGDPSVAGNCC